MPCKRAAYGRDVGNEFAAACGRFARKAGAPRVANEKPELDEERRRSTSTKDKPLQERCTTIRLLSPEAWDTFVRSTLVEGWLEDYDAMTPWTAEVLEIPKGPLTYLFDSILPTMSGADSGDNRMVAIWGHSVAQRYLVRKAVKSGSFQCRRNGRT